MKDLYILSEDISWISHENAKYIFNDRTVEVIKVNEVLEKLLLFCYMPRHEESIIQNLDSDKVTLGEIRLAIANLVKVGILIKNDVQLIEEDSHGESNLASIAILPTLRCNQNCSYCYNRKSNIDQEIDTNSWKRIIDEIKTMDYLNHIIISGGEPLLRLDVIELFLPLKKAGKEIILGTNATLITSENIELIKSAVTRVSVSIDSDIPEMHNATRGDNNFQAVLAGCRLLTKNQIEWQAQSVLTEKNGNSIGKIQKFAESLGASRHVASLELLNGSYSGNRYIEEMESKAFCWDAKKHPLTKHTGCGLGKSYAAIGPDGHIYPCHLLILNEFKGESILDSSLTSAWQVLANSNLREKSHVSNVETCDKCMYRNLCGGGCRGMAYLKTGEFNGHIGKDACLKFKYDFGKRISATIAERAGQ